jgi:hypothetical protein
MEKRLYNIWKKKYYLEDIMNLNTIKDRHRCHRCMILWNFGDLYTCEDTGLYHMCNDSCKQLMILDEYQVICGVSYRIYGLTPREIKVVQAFLHKEWLQKNREYLDKLIVICDPKKNMNLEDKSIEEFGVETRANCKLEHEDEDSIHQGNQDPISNDYTFEQEIQDSNHQEDEDKDSTLDKKDEDNPLHQVFTSLDTIIHQEAPMKIIPQDTSIYDQFLYMYRSTRLHGNTTHLPNSKLRKHSRIDTRRIFFGHIFLWPQRPPPKSNILIIHFVFCFLAKRPPPKPNIFLFFVCCLFFIILEGKDCLKGKVMLQSRIII